MELTDSCWCGHQVRWHVMQVCRWCARMERRYPQWNMTPRHEIAAEMPESYREDAARVIDEILFGGA